MKPGSDNLERPASVSPASVGDALAGLAAARCRVIAQGLSRKSDRHGGVHRARKAIRSLRAILALGGDALGDRAIAIDRSLKQLARGLSALRDAHVAVATAQSLASGDDARCWLVVTAQLQARSDRLLAEALARDPDFAARRGRLAKLAGALAALPWRRIRRRSLQHVLDRSEARAARACAKAKARASAARLHRWRRRVRRQRMQIDALRRVEIGPHALHLQRRKRLRELKKRTDLLGRRQDLEVLARLLPQVCEATELPALRGRLRREMAALACAP